MRPVRAQTVAPWEAESRHARSGPTSGTVTTAVAVTLGKARCPESGCSDLSIQHGAATHRGTSRRGLTPTARASSSGRGPVGRCDGARARGLAGGHRHAGRPPSDRAHGLEHNSDGASDVGQSGGGCERAGCPGVWVERGPAGPGRNRGWVAGGSRQRATPPTDSRCSSVEPSFAGAHEDDGTLRSALSRASRRSIVPAVAGAIPACRRKVDGNALYLLLSARAWIRQANSATFLRLAPESGEYHVN
ncbi:hypothetical protein ACODNH_00270 (plasmid) [Haloarcula sp. NS06]|uniref:hypothetical protein n=1 Tax=Haloarcula sp. NS06 TaxID=3409688 RepID=UPI003DA72161